MMPERFCPKCKTKLNNYNNYFCSSCGQKLPENLVEVSSAVRVKTYPLHADGFRKRLSRLALPKICVNKRQIFILVLLLLLISGGIFIYKFNFLGNVFSFFKIKVPGVVEEPSSSNPIVDVGAGLASGSFENNFFSEYVPKDALFYFEGKDLAGFIDQYVIDANFDEGMRGKAKLLLEPQFAFFAVDDREETLWVFLFIPKDTEVLKSVLKDTVHPKWKFEIIEGRLVMANLDKAFKVVKDAKNKVTLNLSLNAVFVKYLLELPKEGQALVMVFEGGSAALGKIANFNINESLARSISVVLNCGLDHLVIKRKV